MVTVAVCELCAGIGETAQLRKGAILTCGPSVVRGYFRFARHSGTNRLSESACLALPFPAKPAVFKVKCNFPDLRPPDTQNAIKIVSAILPVIHHKRNLRADWLTLTFDEIIEVVLGQPLIQSRVKWVTGGRRKIRRRHPHFSGCRSRTRFHMDMCKV
jgi:hypothetical protein